MDKASRNNLFTAFALLCLICSCSKKDDSSAGDSKGENYSQQAPGKSAHDLLTADRFTTLNIEVLYMKGYAPDGAAIEQWKEFLSSLVHKPGGIRITQTQLPASGKEELSLNDIISIEKKYRKSYTHDNELDVSLIYTDGGYTDPDVLGIAYRNTSICLFGKTIATHSGNVGQVSRTKLMATVLEHESGHLLGLVNTGSDMQADHEDREHIHHCNNQNCLMYYAAETTDILGVIISGNIPPLDDNCRNDLKANGGQ
ncbi:hypothetical protein [Compostibacter hankyongensis]